MTKRQRRISVLRDQIVSGIAGEEGPMDSNSVKDSGKANVDSEGFDYIDRNRRDSYFSRMKHTPVMFAKENGAGMFASYVCLVQLYMYVCLCVRTIYNEYITCVPIYDEYITYMYVRAACICSAKE